MKHELSKRTIDCYTFHLSKLQHLDFDEPELVFNEIKNTKNPKNNKNVSISFIKIAISAIMWKLRSDELFDHSKALSKYRKYITSLCKITEEREQNHQHNATNIPKWADIIAIRDNLAPRKNKDHLVLSLYTYIPPRRLSDFVLMKIISSQNKITDMHFNYYVYSSNMFIFNVYKTHNAYAQQIIIIPKELKQIVDDYIKKKNLTENSLLLGLKNYQNLHVILVKNVGTGIDNIRHSFVNDKYKTYKIPENKMLEDTAIAMGHSLQTHLRYRKFKENI